MTTFFARGRNRRLTLAVGSVVALVAAGIAIAGPGMGMGSSTIVSATFTATTLGNSHSRTCTAANGDAITVTDSDLLTGSAVGNPDPRLTGRATFHVTSCPSTTGRRMPGRSPATSRSMTSIDPAIAAAAAGALPRSPDSRERERDRPGVPDRRRGRRRPFHRGLLGRVLHHRWLHLRRDRRRGRPTSGGTIHLRPAAARRRTRRTRTRRTQTGPIWTPAPPAPPAAPTGPNGPRRRPQGPRRTTTKAPGL